MKPTYGAVTNYQVTFEPISTHSKSQFIVSTQGILDTLVILVALGLVGILRKVLIML